jgi:hypothetical protein
MSEKIYCTSCGAENNPDNTFCGMCGADLKATATPVSQPAETTTYIPPAQTQTYGAPTTTYTPVPPKSGKATAALVIGIISLVGLTWLSWLILGPLISGPLLIVTIVGIVMGAQARKEVPGDRNGQIGMILCIVSVLIQFGGFLFNLIYLLLWF